MTSYATFTKHAEKVTKSASSSRPILKGVHHTADGDVVVTDSHRLYYLKGGYTAGEAFTIDVKTGAHIDGNYPDTQRLIPDDDDAVVTLEINVAETLAAVKALASADKAINAQGKHSTVAITLIDGRYLINIGDSTTKFAGDYELARYDGEGIDAVFVNPTFVADALALFKDADDKVVTLRLYGTARSITIKNNDTMALLLPVRK